MISKKLRMEARENERAGNRRVQGSGEITVFALLDFFFVLFDVAGFDGLEFERTGGDDFKVGAALGAGNHLAFVEPVFIDIQIGFAFGAQNHKASLAD
jgi:hypothetical protein